MRSRFLAALLLLAAACGPGRPAPVPFPTAQPTQAAGVPDTHWPQIYFPKFDRVARAAGLEPLRSSPLPPGRREVRVWIGGGLGVPEHLYRFVADDTAVAGEVVLYWDAARLGGPPARFHDLLVERHAGRCGAVAMRDEMAACRALFTRAPEWGQVLAAAEAAGLWSLPDDSALPADGVVSLDGWGLTVELRDGASYRAYQYGNPQAHAWPEARQAERIAGEVRGLLALVRPSDLVRVYRGTTTGRRGAEFVDCATGASWELSYDLAELARRDGIVFPTRNDPSARYQVEVVGELTPEWLAREWGARLPRVLQVMELRWVRPSSARGCDG
ncbi:MAG TPA: hypothetical protein VFQ45_01185 [Longimicrobium sp.]|nr:hypothetical protein [Longimicrobium sp.]